MTARIRQTMVAALAAGLLLGAAGCSSDDDGVAAPAETAAATTASTLAATEEPSPTASATSCASSGASSSASESPSPTASSDGVTVTLELVDGRPTEKPESVVKLERGQRFTLVATSDKAHEIHIHGFDKMLDLTPGEEGTVTFIADQTGSFVVEVEDTGLELFKLQVS